MVQRGAKVEYPATSEQIEKWKTQLASLKRGGDITRWDIICPVHGEEHASGTIQWSEEDSWWNCQACERVDPETGRKVGASIKALVGWMRKHDLLQATVTDIGTKKEAKDKPPATEEQAESWAATLKDYIDGEDDHYLLTDRGLTHDTIADWKLGLNSHRITIPIYDLTSGEFVNCRVYNHSPGEDDPKIYWYGKGKNVGLVGRIEPDDTAIVVAEGEFDMILAWQLGYSALTTTGGAGSFKKAAAEFAQVVGGKDIILFLDNDEAGKKATRELVKILSSFLGDQAPKSISVVNHSYDKDLTDILVKHGVSEDDVIELIDNAEVVWKTEVIEKIPDNELPFLSMDEANSPKNNERPIRMMARVTAVPTGQAFKTPSRFSMACAQNKGKRCEVCPLGMQGGRMAGMKIRAGDRDQLNFVDQDDEKVKRAIQAKYSLGCSDLSLERHKDINIRKVLIQDAAGPVTTSARGLAPGERIAVLAGLPEKTRVENRVVEFIGKPVSDPKSQKNTFLFWKATPQENHYENYKHTPEKQKMLEVFQPTVEETPLEKLREIAVDLSKITGIVEQELLHQGILLTYTSALEFEYGQKRHIGALDTLIIGDTRTGKSMAVRTLMAHFKAGERPTAENTSLVGLTLGQSQTDGIGWTIRPGLFPRNHGMLVSLEEVGHLVDKGIFEGLSDARTEGRVSTTKINHAELPAVVRKIWIGNPPSGKPAVSVLKETGLSAMKMLFKAREDMARFDFAIGVLGIGVEKSGRLHVSKPIYRQEQYVNLIEWAWSRRPENISWDEGTEEYLANEAIKASKLYKDDIYPLVVGAEFRIKVARVAVAIALATYATEDGENVIVDDEHVDAAIQFFHDLYDTPGMPLLKHSDRVVYGQDRVEGEGPKQKIITTHEHLEFMTWAESLGQFHLRNYPFDRTVAQEVAQEMMRDRVIIPVEDGFVVTEGFTQWVEDRRNSRKGN